MGLRGALKAGKNKPISYVTKTRDFKRFWEINKEKSGALDFMFTQTLFKFSPFGINKTYEMINTKQLKSYRQKGTRIILKKDLIEYLADHCEDAKANNLGLTLRGGQ